MYLVFMMISIGLIVAGVSLYFLPTIVAYSKGHTNKGIILLMNLLLGWTFIVWICTLIWAFIDVDESKMDNATHNLGGNKYEDLERLQRLRQDGVITEAEFEIEKAKLLR